MSRSKRVLLNVLRAAIVLGSLELFSQLVFTFRIAAEDPMELLRSAAYLPGGPEGAFPGARVGGIGPDRARMLRALQDVKEVIHPYVGFVTPPLRSTETLDLEALGFQRGGPFVRARREDTLVVGVFGGSVAKMFVEYRGPEVVFAQLGDLPEFRDKRLVVATLAQDGYKQPQSLFALAYFLSLGGKLDALLLIDGFNEVVLGPVENVPHGVFPFFPRGWAQRVADLNLATEMRALIGEVAFLARRRATHARAILESPLRHSRTVLLAWLASDRWLAAQLSQRRMELQGGPALEQLEYLATGPRWVAPDDASLHRDLVSVWKESSFQMRALCESYGIRFYHFLQPNQHVPGSKPMSSEERAVGVPLGHPYIRHVEVGYPLLREAGADLRASGVQFHDLTDVFSTVTEPVYVDCCHFFERGNELLAEAIAEAIREDSEQSRAAGAPTGPS
jgi:hypothetical protein